MEHEEVHKLLEELRNKIDNSPNDDMIRLDISTVKKILIYLLEKEEGIEDADLSSLFGSRANLPDDKWITKDPNVPFEKWLEDIKREHLKEK
ncbi:hypothetical protein bcgnr5372_46110 [Bacillus luti]